ncbi:hypothetical protein VC83_08383 [Pseudogymnoascus destructans]|uniref:Uncharacterized protein n=2 Tax=Pseudogymnoascus destructans TaxID=655981 RepID=L8FX80_PSED2|nr:uncharacterized protein VC83_08383 [Pseudogymnoascus destructans]ELR05083.1 hypothetical protein GMDG_07125 [Pseudogymnoascus destructans 20631-21]OAF55383.1 hypothetical protein VC83_08383 [Pseudogymnoascus destructans]
MQLSISTIGLYATLSLTAYNDLSISAGQAGDAQAKALAKISIDSTSDLANVSKAELQIVKKVAIQNGKIKNKVLKLSAAVLALQIQEVQGDSSVASKLAVEQKKLNNNIALDTKAAGQDSTAVSFDGTS